jgi:zinc-ribbon domain
MQEFTCPNCGRANPPAARFCQNCGQPLQANASTGGQTYTQPERSMYSPPASAMANSGWTSGGPRTLRSLGERLDGWADLIEDAGDKFEAVVGAFQQRLLSRQVPQVRHEAAVLTTSGMFGKQRPFQLTLTSTGATMAVYIAKFGCDLYVAWELFIRPVWNMAVVWGWLGLSAVLGFLSPTSRDLFSGNFSFTGWILGTVAWSIFVGLLIVAAGVAFKRNPLAFFFKQLDEFDADDIGATMLAVHKSLLHAIDAVGIDTKLLRVKEQFRAGQRDRII